MPTFLITLEPGAVQFPAAPGETLLAAAERAGWALPNSCRNGSCRTCQASLLAGELVHQINWPSLTPEERRAGEVLLCVAEARSDLRLRVRDLRRRP